MNMTQEISPQYEIPHTPVNSEAGFADFDVVVSAAEAVLAEEFAAQDVINGAEALTQEAAAAQPEQKESAVEFNMDMIRLLMFLKDEQARQVVASAIAIDAVGQQHGIKEFTFSNAAAARQQLAERETERLLRARRDEEDDTED